MAVLFWLSPVPGAAQRLDESSMNHLHCPLQQKKNAKNIYYRLFCGRVLQKYQRPKKDCGQGGQLQRSHLDV